MCTILVTLQESIISYCDFATIVIQMIESRQSDMSLVMNIRLNEKMFHMKPLVERVVAMER